MLTTIRKWGNSLGLRIPRAYARDLGWADGTEVELSRDGGRLVARPAPPALPDLAELVAEISEYNIHGPAQAAGEPAPDRGDLVWLHDGEVRRPALVLSPALYNRRTGRALVCPVARRIKGYPFEVVLKVEGRTVGAALADRLESVDWRAARVERADTAPAAAVRAVAARVLALLK